jgi:uncharacterized protein UPF0547
MSTRRGEGWASPLGRAREALEAGHLRAAVRDGWTAGTLAASADDESGLQAVRDFAGTLRRHVEGRLRDQADSLEVYCAAALSRARDPVRSRRSPLARLVLGEAPRRTKTCPDCAETVLADARRCRYCGFLFSPPEP